MAFKTVFEFELPLGHIDSDGTARRKGRMRLATAADEIEPLRDHRVQQNAGYLSVLVLSRVIELDGVDKDKIDSNLISGLYSADFAFLQDMYNRVNQNGRNALPAQCPKCSHNFELDIGEGPPPGEA